MNFYQRITTLIIALAIAVFLFAETSHADEPVTIASAASFVFTPAKDGKRDIICKREVDGSLNSGSASYDKKKKRWSWRSYQTEIAKVVKPGKKISKSKAKKLNQLFAKAEIARQQCIAVERPRIFGSWLRQYDCDETGGFSCAENYTYTFNANGEFVFTMESDVVCPGGNSFPAGRGTSVFYLTGRYDYNGSRIKLYRDYFYSEHTACGRVKKDSIERLLGGTEFGSAIVSSDGNVLSMDLFCPDDLRGNGTLFFCERPRSPYFIRQ
jgi:hypothetical protein